jgi:hypothetical protein
VNSTNNTAIEEVMQMAKLKKLERNIERKLCEKHKE